MSTSRTPLWRKTRPAWSTPCSTRSRGSSAPTSSRVASGKPASGEDSLIARYFRPLATDPGAFGLDDDAAALKPDGNDIVVTTDAIIESVHFLPDDPPDTVARKALRVNLSDLARREGACGRLRQGRARSTDRTLPGAAAARGHGGDRSRLCQRFDGCVGWPCRRSHQALWRLRRIRGDRPGVYSAIRRCARS